MAEAKDDEPDELNEWKASNPRVSAICDGVRKQYEKYGKGDKYNDTFSRHCLESGFDDSCIDAELVVDDNDTKEDNQLVECFEDDLDSFPFDPDNVPSTKKEKLIFIYDLIYSLNELYKARSARSLLDSKASFAFDKMQIDAAFFSVDDYLLSASKSLYKEQCPALWDGDFANDHGLHKVLAVGVRNGLDYLRHLTDDYSRCRVQKGLSIEVKDWSMRQKHRHFEFLHNLGQEDAPFKADTYATFVAHALESYCYRVAPQLQLSLLSTIDGSLEVTVQYMTAAAEWITNLVKSSGGDTTLCPFQFDLCFAFGAPHRVPMGDEDEKEDEKPFVDVVGDIAAKLKANKLKNASTDCKPGDARDFNAFYEQFLEQNKEAAVEDDRSYLHRKRMISMVDRRAQQKDTLFLFEPPADCRDIPSNAVSEWFVSSSAATLLPDSKYSERSPFKGGDLEKMTAEEAAKFKNIGSRDECDSAVLTLSFHVKEEEAVSAYLYFNGERIRFMPDDIGTVLPKLFNAEYGNNADWIQREDEVKRHREAMARCLVDAEFDAFRAKYGK